MPGMDTSPRRSGAPVVALIAAALVPLLAVPAFPAPADDSRVRPARVVSRYIEGGYETLVAAIDAGACTDRWNRGWQVRLDGAAGEPMPWSGVATQSQPDASLGAVLTLVIRRSASAAAAPALGHVY